MIIDDFVCLGRTVPEESSTYGHRVCMAGYSDSMRSLVRVYPLHVQNPLRQRYVSVLSVERNPRDCRMESWKLRDIDRGILKATDNQIPMPTVRKWLRSYLADSIEELNKSRSSLAVLEARGDVRPYFQRRPDVKDPDQLELFKFADADPRPFGAGALDIAPRLEFLDQAGNWHDLQIREWGAYEWVRKHRENAAQLWDNYRLRDGRPTLLLVGNMNNHRNAWLIINVFKDEQADLPLFGKEDLVSVA
jgi:hypothetical protein